MTVPEFSHASLSAEIKTLLSRLCAGAVELGWKWLEKQEWLEKMTRKKSSGGLESFPSKITCAVKALQPTVPGFAT